MDPWLLQHQSGLLASMTQTHPQQPTNARERLRQHFSPAPASTQRWDDLWKAGTFLPWDRGAPNPALVDVLNNRRDLIGAPLRSDGSRKRALVPGFGKGYDVLLLSSYGYDAYGVEGSENAVRVAEGWREEHEGEYKTRDEDVGRGTVTFLFGDFFEKGWEGGLEFEGKGGFDIIYDYTFLSALPPSTRPAWAARMSELLAPSGRLICVEFPTYKEPESGGPPWGLPPVVYEQHLTYPGEEIPYDKKGHIIVQQDRSFSEMSLQRIAHWMPERTHEIGKGTDWVGIWTHR